MSSEFRISLNALVGFSIIFDNYKQSLVMENSGLIEKQDMSPPALKKIKMQENNAWGGRWGRWCINASSMTAMAQCTAGNCHAHNQLGSLTLTPTPSRDLPGISWHLWHTYFHPAIRECPPSHSPSSYFFGLHF